MRVLVIDNPRSGGGSNGLTGFVRELASAGAEVEVRPLLPGEDLHALAEQTRRFDRVVAAGGDGTVSTVAYALRGSGVPILAYPAGTANLLVANLGLPMQNAALVSLVLEGGVRPVDLGELVFADGSATGFAIMAGAGFDADVMAGAAALKATLGAGAYLLSVMTNLTPTVADFRITIDGKLLATDGIAVLLVNFAKIQFDLAVTHFSVADDGLLEVVVLRTRHVAALIPAVWQALLDRLGSVPDRTGLEVYSGREIRVESDPPLPLQYDGEVALASTPFTARVLPGAASFVVPAASRRSPAPRTR